MLPGYIGGQYKEEEIKIDLQSLCAWSGVEFICDRMIAIDWKERSVICQHHPPLPFHILSLNIGSLTSLTSLSFLPSLTTPTHHNTTNNNSIIDHNNNNNNEDIVGNGDKINLHITGDNINVIGDNNEGNNKKERREEEEEMEKRIRRGYEEEGEGIRKRYEEEIAKRENVISTRPISHLLSSLHSFFSSLLPSLHPIIDNSPNDNDNNIDNSINIDNTPNDNNNNDNDNKINEGNMKKIKEGGEIRVGVVGGWVEGRRG